jgi:hypothetical protein
MAAPVSQVTVAKRLQQFQTSHLRAHHPPGKRRKFLAASTEKFYGVNVKCLKGFVAFVGLFGKRLDHEGSDSSME